MALFNDNPIPLLECDMTAVKEYLENRKKTGIANADRYLDLQPVEIENCRNLIKFIRGNRAFLELYEAVDISFLDNAANRKSREWLDRQIFAIAGGMFPFETDAIDDTFTHRKINIRIRWIVPSEYKSTLECVIIAISDTTKLVQADEKIRKNEKHYHNLFSEMGQGFAVHRMLYDEAGEPSDYITLEINRAFEKILGAGKESVVNKKASDMLDSAELGKWLALFGRVTLSGEPAHYQMFSAMHKKFFQGFVYTPEKDIFAVIFEDITAYHLTEEALRKREHDFSTLVENAADMIIRTNTNLRIIYCNPAVEHILGISCDRLIGKTIIEAAGPGTDSDYISKALRTARDTGTSGEIERTLSTSSGKKHFHTHIIPERNHRGAIESILTITRDITERKKPKTSLRKAKKGTGRCSKIWHREFFTSRRTRP